MSPPRVAVLDDTQNIARVSADWAVLDGRAEVTIFDTSFADEDETARRLEPFAILVPMRERTPFPASLLARLPHLRLIALTGQRAPTLDVSACTERGILVCNTGMNSTAATAELAFGLILACARAIPQADAGMRSGGWHGGVQIGSVLEGKRLGIVGLGKLGARVGGYGRAFGMELVAWSQNLTDATAAQHGARRIEKDELFATSDVVSLHLVLSDRTRGIIGRSNLSSMKDQAILVNTARGPLVEEAALLDTLRAGSIRAGLDVFDREPLPAGHALRELPNVVFTPHLGYAANHVFEQVYRESVENIVAFLDGAPTRMLNPEAVRSSTRPRRTNNKSTTWRHTRS